MLLNSALSRPIAYGLRQLLDRVPGKAFDVVINSPGGDIDAAYLIVRQLQKRFGHLTGFVPFWAKSAATLVCLGMDELVLGEFGELGPLDAQIDETPPGGRPSLKSALNQFKAIESVNYKALEFFNAAVSLIIRQAGVDVATAVSMATPVTKAASDPLLSQISPEKLGESTRALEVGKDYASRILKSYHGWNDLRTAVFVDKLVNGYPSHGSVIDLEELGRLGFSAREPDKDEAPLLDDMMTVLVTATKQDNIDLFVPEAEQALAEVASGNQ